MECVITYKVPGKYSFDSLYLTEGLIVRFLINMKIIGNFTLKRDPSWIKLRYHDNREGQTGRIENLTFLTIS